MQSLRLLPLVYFGLTSFSLAQVNSAPVVTYAPGGWQPTSTAIADVNGDGKPDIVVANSYADDTCTNGDVSVLLGNGDGTFQPAVVRGYIPTGYSANSVAIADVNRDGKPDIVVASANYSGGDGVISVFLGNADGTFQTAQTYDSGGFDDYSVAVADVNRDGSPDLVVANLACANGVVIPDCPGGVVGVLLNKGDGTFQPAATYNSGGYEAISVAVSDVNRDGKLDIIVANGCADSSSCGEGGAVGVLLGNGDGTFQLAASYSSGGYDAVSVTVADVNGDGKPDIAVASGCTSATTCANGGVASVLLGNGDGSFRPAATYSSGGAWYSDAIAVADLNGDDKPDLALVNLYGCNECDGSVGVLLNNGSGTFGPAATFDSGGWSAAAVAVGDLNGDGKPDLVVANNLINNGDQSGIVGVLINTSKITYPFLINLVERAESNLVIRDIMTIILRESQTSVSEGHKAQANLLLKIFIEEVKAEENIKLLTSANADALIQEATELMMSV